MAEFKDVSQSNNLGSVLASGINAAATSLVLAAGQGANYSHLSFPYYLVLSKAAETYTGADSVIEVVKVTARSTDTFTVVRGQDGTTARSWVANDKCEMRFVADHIDNIHTVLEAFDVALTMPTDLFNVAGSPVDIDGGTLAVTLDTQAANTALMGPTAGSPAAPTFRTPVAADIPSLPSTKISDFNEAVMDVVADFLQAGDNVSLTEDDSGNTLTITATLAGDGGGMTSELIDLTGPEYLVTDEVTVSAVVISDTSEPGSPQFEYEVDPADILTSDYVTTAGFLSVLLFNNSGGTRTVRSRATFNGVVGSTTLGPTSVTNGQYLNVTAYFTLQDLEAGDILGIKFWADATGMEIREYYKAMFPRKITGPDMFQLQEGVEIGATLSTGTSGTTINYSAFDDTFWLDTGHYQWSWSDTPNLTVPLVSPQYYEPRGYSPTAGNQVNVSIATATATHRKLAIAAHMRIWSIAGGGTTSGSESTIALSLPGSVFDVGPSVTGDGTLTATFDTQTANTVFAGPLTGSPAAPGFRVLAGADMPNGLSTSKRYTASTGTATSVNTEVDIATWTIGPNEWGNGEEIFFRTLSHILNNTGGAEDITIRIYLNSDSFDVAGGPMSITSQASTGYRREGFAMVRSGTTVYLFATSNQDNGNQEWFAHAAWNCFRDATLEVANAAFTGFDATATNIVKVTAQWANATAASRGVLYGVGIKS